MTFIAGTIIILASMARMYVIAPPRERYQLLVIAALLVAYTVAAAADSPDSQAGDLSPPLSPLQSITGTGLDTETSIKKFVALSARGDLTDMPISRLLPPTGTIEISISKTIPDGWLLCDGRLLSSIYSGSSPRYTSEQLAFLGTLIGKNLPDFRYRTALGQTDTDITGQPTSTLLKTTEYMHPPIGAHTHDARVRLTNGKYEANTAYQAKGFDATKEVAAYHMYQPEIISLDTDIWNTTNNDKLSLAMYGYNYATPTEDVSDNDGIHRYLGPKNSNGVPTGFQGKTLINFPKYTMYASTEDRKLANDTQDWGSSAETPNIADFYTASVMCDYIIKI